MCPSESIAAGSLGVSSSMRSGQNGQRPALSRANAARSKSFTGISPRSGSTRELWPVSGSKRTSIGVRTSSPLPGSSISAVKTSDFSSIASPRCLDWPSAHLTSMQLVDRFQHAPARGSGQSGGCSRRARALGTVGGSIGRGCFALGAENLSIGVLAKTRWKRFVLQEAERAVTVRLPLGPQEEGRFEPLDVEPLREFEQVGDEQDLDPGFCQRADHLPRYLGSLPFVCGGERLVAQQDAVWCDPVRDLAHPPELLIELAALHRGVFFAPVVREHAVADIGTE